MRKTVAELAALVDGEVLGEPTTVITGLSGIKEARSGDLTFLANKKYFPLLNQTKAAAVVVPKDYDSGDVVAIRAADPSRAFARIARIFQNEEPPEREGIHETAVIASDVELGKQVSIGPYVVIESGCRIGDGTVITAGVFIGRHVHIGTECIIYANVAIRERVGIGNRVIVHSGTVIGSDGFGFVNVEGIHEKIPQMGTVEIGDDVEIGANVTIDRARFDKTVIGRGTKIDNLVQIAHNVRIGEHCIIISQVGISGSTTLENNVILAGQVGVAGHITIGEGSVVASKSGIPNSLPPHSRVWGNPARPHMNAKRINASLPKVPEMVRTLKDMEKRLAVLESRLNKLSTS